jgi:signal transduction histidine kinase
MGAPLLAATIAIELLAALLLAFTFVRRPTDREYLFGALFAAAAAVHATGAMFVRLSIHGASTSTMERLSWLGLVAAMPLEMHFAVLYGPNNDRRRSWLAVAYGLAAILAGVTWAGGLAPSAAVGGHLHHPEPVGLQELATRGAATVTAGVTLALLARCYLDGRREALAVVIGATVLTAASINDLAIAGGSMSAAYVVDGGLLSLVLGITATISARYTTVAAELDRRTTELRTRTHELRRSYEDLRTAQEELVKKEQLAVVGELAAVIAHEVRNPLAIIANAVAGLRKQSISREDHETLLAILDEETSRLNRLVTDLLRYARPVNVQRSQFVLADLLERALTFAKTKKRGIKMELLRDAPGREGVWGDANLLRQVFDNLIDNAVQAMGSGGTLTVRMRSDTQEGVGGVAVDIIDTGEGMDTQVRSRARDPFFTTRPSGTGLGLAIVDRIVDAHGGQFAIDSRAGEGTTVTVFLPTGSASEPPQARGRSSRPGPRTSTTPRRAAP